MSSVPSCGLHRQEGRTMFQHTKAFSGFSVDDIPRAKEFYGETLGLRVTEENGMLTLHIAGDRPTLVYPKPDHTPATFTILNFPVGDIDAAVDDLVARGVQFERYEAVGEQDDLAELASGREAVVGGSRLGQRERRRYRHRDRAARQQWHNVPLDLP